MVGFGCELLSMTEITEEERKNVKNQGSISASDISLESYRIRGDDQENSMEIEQEKTLADSPTKKRMRRSSSVKVEIKTAEIHLGSTEIGSIREANSYAALE